MNTTIENYISRHPEFTTKEFFTMMRAENPDVGRSTIYKSLNTLCSQKIINQAKLLRYARRHQNH